MKALRNIRQARNLTQEKCAEAVGVSHRTWCRWEKGDTKRFTAEQRERVAEILGATLEQLDGRVPFEPPTPAAS